jgi:anti-anti-sigma regulatory factor
VTRAGETASLDHNLRTVVMNPQLRITAVLTGADWQVDDAVRSLEAAATP